MTISCSLDYVLHPIYDKGLTSKHGRADAVGATMQDALKDITTSFRCREVEPK